MRKIINHLFSKLENQPTGFYTLLYTEICELYGQFSITALLILYMTSVFKSEDNEAFICYGTFTAFIYAIPLLGGYIADRISGFKITVLLGILLMTIGNIFLIFPNINFLYLGLAIFSTGCGLFTPAITTVFGRLYAESDKKRDNAFTLYYIAKNVGAMLATVIGSVVAIRYGYNFAYLISTAIMFSGYIVFLLGSKKLQPSILESANSERRKRSPVLLLIGICTGIIIITKIIFVTHSSAIFMLIVAGIAAIVIASLYYKFNKEDRMKTTIIMLSILMMVIFSTFLGQGGTTLNLFIERIVDRNVGDYTIPPSMFYALEPFFMILFGSTVMIVLSKIKGNDQIAVGFTKISIGLITLAIGFLIFFVAAWIASNSGIKPSVRYVISSYALFPIAELSIMPIVISLITRISPRGYEGFMIGLYMSGNAIASYMTGIFSKMGNVNFSTGTLAGIISAAKIYQYTFLISALVLFGFGILSLVVIILYHKIQVERPLILITEI